MSREPSGEYRFTPELQRCDLTSSVIHQAMAFVYEILDVIDEALVHQGSDRLADIIELANLSSMIGNLLRAGVANASGGRFQNNGPHKHPDLLHASDPSLNVEIKVALEDNSPKGHLAKSGWHLTCHYVLCKEDGSFVPGPENRGNIP